MDGYPLKSTLEPWPESTGHLFRITSSGRTYAVRRLRGELARTEKLERHHLVVRELSRDFGVAIAPFMIVLAATQASPVAFVISKLVSGETLSDRLAGADDEFLSSAAEPLYLALISYLGSKRRSGGYYFSDLRNDQFVVGSVRPGSEAKVYLVDHDPVHHHMPARTRPNQIALSLSLFQLHGRVAQLTNMLLEAERNSGIQLSRARDELLKLFDLLRDSDPLVSWRVEAMQAALLKGENLEWTRWIDTYDRDPRSR